MGFYFELMNRDCFHVLIQIPFVSDWLLQKYMKQIDLLSLGCLIVVFFRYQELRKVFQFFQFFSLKWWETEKLRNIHTVFSSKDSCKRKKYLIWLWAKVLLYSKILEIRIQFDWNAIRSSLIYISMLNNSFLTLDENTALSKNTWIDLIPQVL